MNLKNKYQILRNDEEKAFVWNNVKMIFRTKWGAIGIMKDIQRQYPEDKFRVGGYAK